MNEYTNLQTFNHPQMGNIRILNHNDQPWFCLTDICKSLKIQSRTVRARLTKEQNQKFRILDANNHHQQTTFITESGLYSAILESRKNEARNFRQWVTTEVLPAIRQNGAYVHTTPNDTPETLQAKAQQAAQMAVQHLKQQLAQQAEQLKQANAQLDQQAQQLNQANTKLANTKQIIADQNHQLATLDIELSHKDLLLTRRTNAYHSAIERAALTTRENRQLTTQLEAQQTQLGQKDMQLLVQQNELEEQSLQLTAQQPSVHYAQALLATPDAITINEMAKILIQAGYITGQNRLFQWLRQNGYLCSRPCFRNLPTQEYMTQGYFVVREHIGINVYGNTVISHTTHVTPKGQQHILTHFAQHRPEQPA